MYFCVLIFMCVCLYIITRLTSLFFSFQILDENIRKVKLSTPDYREMGDDKAIEDFKQRRGTFDFDGWTLTVGYIFTLSSDVTSSYFISCTYFFLLLLLPVIVVGRKLSKGLRDSVQGRRSKH